MSGWARVLVREIDNRVAPLRLALDRLNDTTASLGNATTKTKEDIQKMEQEREEDREYVRILEEALEGTSVEMERLGTDLDQRVMDLLLPMNDTILLVGHAVWRLQNTTEDIRDKLTERLEVVEKSVKYKGSTSSAKTSHFQGQLNTLRDATRVMAANITSLESQLESVRDSEAQLRKDVQALQQQSGQVDLDLSALEAKVGSTANLTARVKNLEKRMARRDATFTTGNKLLSSLTTGGSMLNAPGGKAPVTFLKNPGQIGFPMGSGPSSPAGVAPSHMTPPSGALSASTSLAGAGWPASANSVIAGTNKNLMPVTNSGASGGHITPNPPRTTVSPGLVGNTGAASSPGTTGGLGTTVNAIVTSTPRPAGNASVTGISGTTVNPGTAGNTNVTSIPGVASSPGTAVVPRTAGNTSITSTPAPTSNPGATGNTSVTSTLGASGSTSTASTTGGTSSPGAASNPGATGNTSVTSTPGASGSTSTASTTGGTSSPGAASNPGATGKPGASGSPGTPGNPGAVGNTSVASNPVAAANPGAARGLGASGNSGSAGKPGAFGNNGIGGSRGAAGARARGMSAGRSVGP
ncbi:collagen, type I, alpha 1a-like [Penaeus indicus]|uniref:collagen, type I, alpha 1a-like n=1 Tax=Penaeus indicus TaxID=29960 RepID=UPI00300DBA94